LCVPIQILRYICFIFSSTLLIGTVWKLRMAIGLTLFSRIFSLKTKWSLSSSMISILIYLLFSPSLPIQIDLLSTCILFLNMLLHYMLVLCDSSKLIWWDPFSKSASIKLHAPWSHIVPLRVCILLIIFSLYFSLIFSHFFFFTT
jgi:hypothetical protein